MSVSQTGGSDLCVRHIRRKMGVDGVDGLMDIFIISVKKMCVGKKFFVLFFCVGICSDDGDGDGWGAMQKNRLNIGKMRLEHPMFFCVDIEIQCKCAGFFLF